MFEGFYFWQKKMKKWKMARFSLFIFVICFLLTLFHNHSKTLYKNEINEWFYFARILYENQFLFTTYFTVQLQVTQILIHFLKQLTFVVLLNVKIMSLTYYVYPLHFYICKARNFGSLRTNLSTYLIQLNSSYYMLE